MKKTFVAVLLVVLVLAVMGVAMSLAAPNVVVNKTAITSSDATGQTAYPGDLITYTLAINANTTFVLTDTIPVNTTYRASGAQYVGPGTGTGTGTGDLGGYISYKLLSGGSATVTLTVRVNTGTPAGTVIANAAAYVDGTTPGSSTIMSTKVWGKLYLPTIRK